MLRHALPALLLATPLAAQAPVDDGTGNVLFVEPAFPQQTEAPEVFSDIELEVTTIAGTLARPWGLAVLPGGAGFLVTERGGTLRHITRDGTIGPEIRRVPEVRAIQQGGLLDVAIANDFAQTRQIYLTYSARSGLSASTTALARAELAEDFTTLREVEVLWEQSPASSVPVHFGSRVLPLPEGSLLVTTGDRFTPENRQLAQEPDRAAYGVTIMIDPDGRPIESPIEGALPGVFSYGHRNIQGAARHPETGALWTLEHGPAGGDELNVLEEGGNYGWPIVSYGQNYNGSAVGSGEHAHAPDFVEPRYFWDPSIAPSDMVFYEGEMFAGWQGDILLGALAGQSLVRLELDGTQVIGEERLRTGEGRVRDIEIDEDGAILLLIDADPGSLIRLTPTQ